MSPLEPASEIAAIGDEIYARFRDDLLQTHAGEFVAIDVDSETLYLSATHQAALAAGESASPHGRFHVVRVL